jgi:hypothetical protein
MRSMSAGSGSPVAAHIIGKPDAGVIPGMVLISLMRTSPAGVQKKSTRASPSQEIASNAAQASCWIRVAALAGIGAGISMRLSAPRYLAWKS